jgi:penicillin G amidase
MRIIPLIVTAVVTLTLIIVLSIPLGSLPPLGRFLSPQHGFWQNAEPVDGHTDLDLNFPQLKDKVQVYFDDRMVPHVFAQNDDDLYFVQGYLHAKFRLWQMEFQTYAAAGRLSEILGAGPNGAYLNYDRNMRRVGMVYGARRTLDSMERDPITHNMLNAYTAGVNAYIDHLPANELPLEYRLLNYVPEHWNHLKTALFLKYMSYDLTGAENDIEYTNVRNVLSKQDFEELYPIMQDSLDPIVPKGAAFYKQPAVRPKMPVNSDSLYFLWNTFANIFPINKPDKDNGSNNWAVDSSKTKSGRPILCNDPHLGLNLPSLWFEMQLHTPQYNVYGVTFPGSPAVVIGFNDSCAWGVTNAGRDVKDYFNIQFRDDSKQQYRFNGEWKKSDLRIDTFKIKGKHPFYDTIAYTIFGPVQYDGSFTGNNRTEYGNFAVRWKAHDPSNELKTFYLLNRMTNYSDYRQAIRNFSCPGQNFVFASKKGDIAIWQQGKFPAKWRRQGDFIMPGTDTAYLWQGSITPENNPHVDSVKPDRGFVSSANQMPADTTYPWYLGGSYPLYRGIIINRYLRQMNNITIDDMKKMQTDNYNVFAETALPVLLQNIDVSTLSTDEKKYLDLLRSWKFNSDPTEKGPAIFQIWFDMLQNEVWNDDFDVAHKPVAIPEEATLVKCLRNPNFKFADNITTTQVESVQDVVTASFKKAVPQMALVDGEGTLEWGKYKDTGIRHLLRLGPLSRLHLSIGGGVNIINATKQFHGPSWRMIVELKDKTEAWGVYPGGQSGNPGSKYYDSFINQWAGGKYNRLWVMTEADKNDKRIKFKMTFN